jgi:hypothetical protein
MLGRCTTGLYVIPDFGNPIFDFACQIYNSYAEWFIEVFLEELFDFSDRQSANEIRTYGFLSSSLRKTRDLNPKRR